MSIWHWLVVFLVFAPFVGIIFVAISRARAEQVQGIGITAGLKGWLFIFAASLWFGVLRAMAEIVKSIEKRDPQVTAQFPLLDQIDFGALVIQLILVILCAVSLTRGKANFKNLWISLFAFIAISPFLTSGVGVFVLSVKYNISVSFGDAIGEIPPDDWGAWFSGLVAMGLWTIYVFRSRRVAATCVA